MTHPDCIKHWQEIQQPNSSHYPDSVELLSIRSPFGSLTSVAGPQRLHELPGLLGIRGVYRSAPG